MKNLFISILLVLFTLAMFLTQNYHTQLVDLDVDKFILQEETTRKEFILVVFNHFKIDFDEGLEGTLSRLTYNATRSMPWSVRDCLASERLRMNCQNDDDFFYRNRLVDLDVEDFILQEETTRKEFVLVVFKIFDIDFDEGLEATLSTLPSKATRSMPQSVRDCLESEKLRMRCQNDDEFFIAID